MMADGAGNHFANVKPPKKASTSKVSKDGKGKGKKSPSSKAGKGLVTGNSYGHKKPKGGKY